MSRTHSTSPRVGSGDHAPAGPFTAVIADAGHAGSNGAGPCPVANAAPPVPALDWRATMSFGGTALDVTPFMLTQIPYTAIRCDAGLLFGFATCRIVFCDVPDATPSAVAV
ncbi:hypothetical protein ABT352_33350 [Streptosporangium sp. NPDC000563]|uniref:hypothetical protein n=1 Tax=Streptosporangium sp. NPDC000563 TaxID=3154366 RepID=UPI0033313510